MKRLDGSKIRLLVGCVIGVVLSGGSARADFFFGEPTNVLPPVNRSNQDYDPFLSADGLMLLFSSGRPGGSGGSDIWMATRATTHDPWRTPVNLGPIVNSAHGDTDPSLSSDGLSLYFTSDRPDGFGGGDIWMTKRATPDDSWSEPLNLGPTVNSVYNETDPSISADGLTLYFSEWALTPYPRPGGWGGSDIWVTTRPTKDAPWAEPRNLGPMVNSESNDFMQGLSIDGLVLFFASERIGGLGRAADLYMTRRATTSDPWGEAVSLGPAVNSPAWDLDPEVSADGSTLYFGSSRSGPDELDLWQAPIIPIADFNGDGSVDGADIYAMVDRWGTADSVCDVGPRAWGDGIVDVEDLIVLAEHIGQELYDPTLLAHWTLDESDGTIAHDSVSDNDATILGVPLWQPASGAVDGALELDGMTFLMTASALFPVDGPFSVLAWVKGGAPGQGIIMQPGGVDLLSADPTGGTLMTELAHTGDGLWLCSQSVISDGDWHRIGVAWDGSTCALYVDGALAAEAPEDGLVGSPGKLIVGCGKNMAPGTFWTGLIDDVRIYNRAVQP